MHEYIQGENGTGAMSVLFDAAEYQASKRKSKLLEGSPGLRQVFAGGAPPAAVFGAPLLPTTAPGLRESASTTLDAGAGVGIDLAWALGSLCFAAPFAAGIAAPGPGLAYACAWLYPSLFLSLPGLSVHFFCLFLLLSSRCPVGFACHGAAIVLMVAAVEAHCMYGASLLFSAMLATGVVAGTLGQALLVRGIEGRDGVRYVVYAGHAVAVVLAVVGLASELAPVPTHTASSLIAAGCIAWCASTWHTLLPVRIAYAQLYKTHP